MWNPADQLRTLREYAERKFSREKVEVRPNSKITAVGADWIELESQDGVKTKGECWKWSVQLRGLTRLQNRLDFWYGRPGLLPTL